MHLFALVGIPQNTRTRCFEGAQPEVRPCKLLNERYALEASKRDLRKLHYGSQARKVRKSDRNNDQCSGLYHRGAVGQGSGEDVGAYIVRKGHCGLSPGHGDIQQIYLFPLFVTLQLFVIQVRKIIRQLNLCCLQTFRFVSCR